MEPKNHQKSWTLQELARLRYLREAGYTHEEIAEELQRTKTAVSEAWMRVAPFSRLDFPKDIRSLAKRGNDIVKRIEYHQRQIQALHAEFDRNEQEMLKFEK